MHEKLVECVRGGVEKKKHVMMKDGVKELHMNCVKAFHPELQTTSASSPVTEAH